MIPRILSRPDISLAAYAAPVIVLALLLNVTAEPQRKPSQPPRPTLEDLQKQAGNVQHRLGEQNRPGNILREIDPLLRRHR